MPTIITTVNGLPKSLEVSENTFSRFEEICKQEDIHPQTLCRIIIRLLVESHIVPKESHVIEYLDEYFPHTKRTA